MFPDIGAILSQRHTLFLRGRSIETKKNYNIQDSRRKTLEIQ